MITKYTYAIFATPKGKGYACFAINREKGSLEYRVAASFCHPLDKKIFSKKIAKIYAATKLSTTGGVAINNEKNSFCEILGQIIPLLPNTPKWAKKAFDNSYVFHTLKLDNFKSIDLIDFVNNHGNCECSCDCDDNCCEENNQSS